MPKTRKVSAGCGGRCSVTRGHVENYANDVTIQSVTKNQVNMLTGANVPNTTQNVPPENLPQDIQQQLQDFLDDFVSEAEVCDPGCYCSSFGEIITREETFNSTITTHNEVVRIDAWTNAGQMNLQQAMDAVSQGQLEPINDQTGQASVFNPALDGFGNVFLNCCAVPTFEFQIVNRFKFDIVLQLTATLATEEGECQSVDGGSGGTVA